MGLLMLDLGMASSVMDNQTDIFKQRWTEQFIETARLHYYTLARELYGAVDVRLWHGEPRHGQTAVQQHHRRHFVSENITTNSVAFCLFSAHFYKKKNSHIMIQD